MSKKAMWIQVTIFLLFICVFFVLILVSPDKDFSEQENRSLQTAPKFTLSSLFSGNFTSTYETYITDQFPLRDSWITFKARCELLSGKDQNNDIYLCEGETLIEAFSRPDMDDYNFNLDAVNTLAENNDIPVYFALIPSAAEIWRELLPDNAPNESQKELIDYSYAYCAAETIDVYSNLKNHSDEELYYRTDHHWTSLGAYYGYESVIKAMGMTPLPLEQYTERIASESFYGTTYSSSGFSWIAPDTISTYVEQGDSIITNYPSGAAVESSLYVSSFLEAKDKYSYFYGGNTPLLHIETCIEDAPSLLIIRDSYMDSMSPYFMAHFSEIHILDLRYYKTSLNKYIEENDIDNILVCYSVSNFSKDDSVFLAGF